MQDLLSPLASLADGRLSKQYPLFLHDSYLATGNVDEYFITLAYWFFYLRVIHSIYHIFFNQLIFNGGFPSTFFSMDTGNSNYGLDVGKIYFRFYLN